MMTMTSPRNTSTETNRGACAGEEEVWMPTGETVGELTAVTIRCLCKYISIFRAYFDRNEREDLPYLRDVNRLQLRRHQLRYKLGGEKTARAISCANQTAKLFALGSDIVGQEK
jgi:hypothetical protein